MIFLPGAFALKAMEKAVEAGEQIDIPALDELKPDVRIIQVTETVKIMYDLSDGWFGLVDDCGSEYDQPGGVALGLDEIDLLIVRLGELRKEMERAGVTPGKRPCHV